MPITRIPTADASAPRPLVPEQVSKKQFELRKDALQLSLASDVVGIIDQYVQGEKKKQGANDLAEAQLMVGELANKQDGSIVAYQEGIKDAKNPDKYAAQFIAKFTRDSNSGVQQALGLIRDKTTRARFRAQVEPTSKAMIRNTAKKATDFAGKEKDLRFTDRSTGLMKRSVEARNPMQAAGILESLELHDFHSEEAKDKARKALSTTLVSALQTNLLNPSKSVQLVNDVWTGKYNEVLSSDQLISVRRMAQGAAGTQFQNMVDPNVLKAVTERAFEDPQVLVKHLNMLEEQSELLEPALIPEAQELYDLRIEQTQATIATMTWAMKEAASGNATSWHRMAGTTRGNAVLRFRLDSQWENAGEDEKSLTKKVKALVDAADQFGHAEAPYLTKKGMELRALYGVAAQEEIRNQINSSSGDRARSILGKVVSQRGPDGSGSGGSGRNKEDTDGVLNEPLSARLSHTIDRIFEGAAVEAGLEPTADRLDVVGAYITEDVKKQHPDANENQIAALVAETTWDVLPEVESALMANSKQDISFLSKSLASGRIGDAILDPLSGGILTTENAKLYKDFPDAYKNVMFEATFGSLAEFELPEMSDSLWGWVAGNRTGGWGGIDWDLGKGEDPKAVHFQGMKLRTPVIQQMEQVGNSSLHRVEIQGLGWVKNKDGSDHLVDLSPARLEILQRRHKEARSTDRVLKSFGKLVAVDPISTTLGSSFNSLIERITAGGEIRPEWVVKADNDVSAGIEAAKGSLSLLDGAPDYGPVQEMQKSVLMDRVERLTKYRAKLHDVEWSQMRDKNAFNSVNLQNLSEPKFNKGVDTWLMLDDWISWSRSGGLAPPRNKRGGPATKQQINALISNWLQTPEYYHWITSPSKDREKWRIRYHGKDWMEYPQRPERKGWIRRHIDDALKTPEESHWFTK